MQIGKKRKTAFRNLQSLSTFAEKQRAVELEDKKVKKHGLRQQGRTNQPLLRTTGGPPPKTPIKIHKRD